MSRKITWVRRICVWSGLLIFLSWLCIKQVCNISWDKYCGGHLERASTANSIDLARQELEIVVQYAEAHRQTSGNTNILWNTPQNDVGFWYQNLKASLDELKSIKPDVSNLEKSNILLKLHETLTRNNELTAPGSIYLYPYNMHYFFLCMTGIFLFVVGCVLFYWVE